MTNTIDFSAFERDRQGIAGDLAKRVEVITAGLGDIKSIPNDLYGNVELKDIDVKHKELNHNYCAEYLSTLFDLNSSLLLLHMLSSVAVSRLTGETALHSDFEAAVKTGESIMKDQRIIEGLRNNMIVVAHKHRVEISREDGEITMFCRKYEPLINLDMDEGDFLKLRGQTLANVTQCFNMLADLEVEYLDVEMGYLYHVDDLDSQTLENTNKLMHAIAQRSDAFLSVSNKYLKAADSLYDQNYFHDDTNSPSAPH